MADKELDDVTDSGALDGTERFHVVKGAPGSANSRKALISRIYDWLKSKSDAIFLTSAHGATMRWHTLEEEITLTGASVSSTIQFPANALSVCVAMRVTEAVTGGVTGIQIGTATWPQKYGNAIPILALGATYASAPVWEVLTSPASIQLLPAGAASFTAGKVRATIFVLTFSAATS